MLSLALNHNFQLFIVIALTNAKNKKQQKMNKIEQNKIEQKN